MLVATMVMKGLDGEKVFEIIGNSGESGKTITEIVKVSRLPRSVVRILLARLEGAGKVRFRKVGMAKVYFVGGEDE